MALTDKLTAIADAIRCKTGGTEEMTLDAMVSAIEGIETGGGVAYAKGSFTLTSEKQKLTITHNLNSNSVLVLWSIRNTPAIFINRYRAVMGLAISSSMFPTRIVDVSSYNTAGLTETEFSPSTAYNAVDNISAYTSSPTHISGSNYHIDNTDRNTFNLRTRESFHAGFTYDWVAIDLNGVTLPWA